MENKHGIINGFDAIKEANATIMTTEIKGKEYAQVNERIKAFRMVHPLGLIETNIISLENGVVTMQTKVVSEDGVLLGTGYAQEKESSSFINKTSFIENCETSAIGRALGICGFGIDTSICSAEELKNALENQKKESEEKPTEETLKNFSEVKAKVMTVTDIGEKKFKDYVLKKAKVKTMDIAELSNEEVKTLTNVLFAIFKKKNEEKKESDFNLESQESPF